MHFHNIWQKKEMWRLRHQVLQKWFILSLSPQLKPLVSSGQDTLDQPFASLPPHLPRDLRPKDPYLPGANGEDVNLIECNCEVSAFSIDSWNVPGMNWQNLLEYTLVICVETSYHNIPLTFVWTLDPMSPEGCHPCGMSHWKWRDTFVIELWSNKSSCD